jgi:hypothetical protein
MASIFKLPVHPAAAVFPMLADNELDELADDIRAHGLRHAIVVKDGHLIDGRNRLEACRRAGIEPRTEELNGTDPVAYILSANVNRRHLTKGQRAMAIAKLYPEPSRLKRKDSGSIKNIEHVSRQYVDHARTVLAALPQAADAVLAGTKSLNDAYAEAMEARADLESEAKRITRLKQRAPDLGDLVETGQMKLVEAESAYETRQEETRRQRQAVLELLNGLERMLDVLASGKRRANVVEHLQQPDDKKHAAALMRAWIKNLTETLEELR